TRWLTVFAKSLDKFAGVLSILWVVGGYALLRFGVVAYPHFFHSAESVVPIPIIWFGAGLLLVIAGFRRGNTLGRICSVCAVVLLFWLAEPIHGVGRRFGNLFRKDEYAQVYYGAPECRVTAAIHTDKDVAIFFETVRQFAKSHDIRE